MMVDVATGIARILKQEGVEKVFGIIDGTYFGFYASLHKLGIEIVTPRHESCAAHMAGAYARLTEPRGAELPTHCDRMLGSAADGDQRSSRRRD